MYLKSQFIVKADEPIKNSLNVYSLNTLKKIVDDFYKEDFVLGELILEKEELQIRIDWLKKEYKTKINLSKASHLVKDLYLTDKNELLANIRILNTPRGIELEKNLDRVFFALEGTGILRANKSGFYTVDNYKFISINANLDDNLKFKNAWRKIDEEWTPSRFN